MGKIQQFLSKYVDPHPEVEVQEDLFNENIRPTGIRHLEKSSFEAFIGTNYVKNFITDVLFDSERKRVEKLIYKQDFNNGKLSCLLKCNYVAETIATRESETNKEELEISFFRGELKRGVLKTGVFEGTILDGCLNGKFRVVSNANSVAHLGMSLTGEIEYLSSKDECGFFGFQNQCPTILNNDSRKKSVSVLLLETGQHVRIKSSTGADYFFKVEKSCKDSGDGTAHLKELTNNQSDIVIYWQDFRQSTEERYDKKSFDLRSNFTIGQSLSIPKLFEDHWLGNIIEIEVSDNPFSKNTSVSKKKVNFKPKKVKV